MWQEVRPVSQQRILVIVGPTASGKTSLALELACALGGEILGCDALQIRAGLPLLTAKPTASELLRRPHHLIGTLAMEQAASAATYARLADKVLAELDTAASPAVLCGGTGLYLRALCEGLFDGPPADLELRARLREEAASAGIAALHERLKQHDPVAAGRIGPADYVRIERALEVFIRTGRPLSEWLSEHQAERARGPRYRTLRIGLDPGPDVLRANIGKRIEAMLAGGLLEEVAAVKSQGRLRDPPLGYDLVSRHLDGQLTLTEMTTALLAQTAQYARRQRTWFRREPDVTWYPDAAAVPIAEIVSAFRSA